MKNILLLIAIHFIFLSCKKEKINRFNEVYDVEFVGLWSANTHPLDFPSNASFSSFQGISHSPNLDIIGLGLSASQAVAEIVTTGSNLSFIKTFDDYRALNIALDRFEGQSKMTSTGGAMAQIGVEPGRHVVSIFSALDPSPDWFVAASTSLLDPQDGLWYDYVEISAQIFDAGVDSGQTFLDEDMPNISPRAVQLINNGPLTNGTDSVRSLAKIIFRRVK